MTLRIKNYKKTEFHGRSFHSKAEANLYAELLLRERAKEISNIRCQVKVRLTNAEIGYIPDFVVFCNKRNQDIYIEMKGFETDVWLIKKKLWKFYGPGILEIYKPSPRGSYLSETITPLT